MSASTYAHFSQIIRSVNSIVLTRTQTTDAQAIWSGSAVDHCLLNDLGSDVFPETLVGVEHIDIEGAAIVRKSGRDGP